MNRKGHARCPTCGSHKVKVMIRNVRNGEPPLLFQYCSACGAAVSLGEHSQSA